VTNLPQVQVAAAKLALRTATAADLKVAAGAAVDAGIVTPDIAALATLSDDTLAEAEPLFRKVLDDLQVTPPSPDAAVWILLRVPIQAIADGSVAVEEGLQGVMGIFRSAGLHEVSDDYVGDSHDIQHLVGLYWEIRDLAAHTTEVGFTDRYGPALEERRTEAIGRAKTWLTDHAA
jgi:hypothetical protein